MAMICRGNGVTGNGWAMGLGAALSLAAWLAAFPGPASAQMFSDRPPPVPPASVPDAPPTGPAMNLAPPSGPAAGPNLPAPLTQPSLNQPTLTQPSISNAPAAMPPPGASTAGQAVLSLTAKYGKDLSVITNGLVWRVFADKPDETGTFKLIREEGGATPNNRLQARRYGRPVRRGLVRVARAGARAVGPA